MLVWGTTQGLLIRQTTDNFTVGDIMSWFAETGLPIKEGHGSDILDG